MTTIKDIPTSILTQILEPLIFGTLLHKSPIFTPEETYRIAFRRCGRLSLVCQRWHDICRSSFRVHGPEILAHELSQTRDRSEIDRLENMRELYHRKFDKQNMNDPEVLAAWTESIEVQTWVDNLSEGLRALGQERKRIQREWDETRPGEVFLMDEYESASLLVRFIQA